MGETRRRVTQELECDVSAVRTVKKRHAAKQWLKSHGDESFDQVLPTDLVELEELLSIFEAINNQSENLLRAPPVEVQIG